MATAKREERQFQIALIKKGWLTPKQLKKLLRQKGDQTLEELLVSHEVLSENDLKEIWSEVRQQKRTRFGKYEIVEKIARGAMGEVYKVRHQSLKQIYALKAIIAGEDASEETINRFDQEARIIAKLQHPNIIQIIDSGKEGKIHFYCMEYIEGTNLEELMVKGIQISTGLKIFETVLKALDYAHNQGVIHRDLKPSNIFITNSGIPKIGDFGLSKDIERNEESQQLTLAGEILGTPAYMAPEQIAGYSDSRGDVYSIGSCLYRMLTSRCPFESQSLHKLFYKIIVEEPIPPSKLNSKVSRDLDAIVLKALSKSKRERYQTADDFAKDLACFLKGFPIQAKAINWQERLLKWTKRNGKLLIAGSLMLLLCFGLFFYTIYNQKQQQINRAQTLYKKAQEEIRFAREITIDSNIGREKKIEFILKALNHLNIALSLTPKAQAIEQEILRMSAQLITLACQSQEYDLASYLASELKKLTILSSSEKEKWIAYIEKTKTKNLSKHLTQLNFWCEKFKHGHLEPQERENAIFEIAKMPEPEITQKLIEIFNEGTSYFLTGKDRTSKKDEFYKTMAIALGRMEKPNIGYTIFKSLEQMYKKMGLYSTTERPTADIQYMVILVQALSYTKATHFARQVTLIRDKMGIQSLFWQRTRLPYRTLARLDDLAQTDPLYAESYFKRGQVKMVERDYKGAIQDFNQAIQLNRNYSLAYNARGSVKNEIGQYQEAIEDYSTAIQIQASPELYSNRGLARYKAGHIEKAIQDYSKAIAYDPKLTQAYINRGVARRALGDLLGAIQDYSKAIEINPRLASAYLNRGVLKRQLKEYQGSLADYNKAISLNPKYSDAFFNRGILKKALGDLNGALMDQTKAIQLNPNSDKAYYNRGNTKTALGDFNGAIQDYTQAISISPRFAQAYQARGVAKNAMQKVREALEDFNTAIQYDPLLTSAYSNRGTLYFNQGKTKQAIADFSMAIQLSPELAQPYYNRGFAYLAKGKLKETKEDFRQFLKRTKTNKRASIRSARLEILNLFPELKQETTNPVSPDLGELHFRNGNKKFEQSQYKLALIDYQKALSYLPQKAKIYYQIARSFKKLKKLPKAIEILEEGLQRTKESELSKLFLDLLLEQCIQQIQQKQYLAAKTTLQKFQQYAPKNHPALSRIQKLLQQIKSKQEEQKE